MKSIFSEIYEALEATGALRYDHQAEDDGKVYDLEDEFESELSPEMKEKYREIVTGKGQIDREMEQAIFARGVRLGMQLMLEAILERECRK